MKNLEWVEQEEEKKVSTVKQAVELSIKKWKYIVKNNGSSKGLINKYPEFNIIQNTCGLCELCNRMNNECSYTVETFNDTECPLTINGMTCGQEAFGEEKNHPWLDWYENRTKTNAERVLKLIQAIKY
jgi:hypothetical protein